MFTIADEVHGLSRLSDVDCSQFRHVIIGAKVGVTNVTTAQTLMTYTVPDNFAFILSVLGYRSIPTPNDAGLTVGDWRSYDFDATGTTKFYIQVNGTPKTGTNLTYFALFNRPLLFAFKGGDIITLIAKRGAASVPASFNALIVMHGYLTLPCAYDGLANNLTNAEGTFA